MSDLLIIGPGFPLPDERASIPVICEAGTHRFAKHGVCKRCRRTVPELARLGLAQPVSCEESGVHVRIGSVCIECQVSLKASG